MGKILILSFDDNENEIMNKVLDFINIEDNVYQPEKHIIQRKLTFQDIIVDLEYRVVLRNNKEIKLTYLEFEILQLLARHPGKVFSKEVIYDVVWKDAYSGDYNIVTSHISNIRKKVEIEPAKKIYIYKQ